MIQARLTARVLALAGLVALVLLGAAGPGWAHPFGPPLAAKVTAAADMVEVTWSAADDDLAALTRVAGARGVSVYLGEHVGVTQDGRACARQAVRTESLVMTGAVLRFRCPAEVTAVTLTVTTLTDVNQAYRTLSTTPDGGGALHTATAPAQVLRFGGGAASRPQPASLTDPLLGYDLLLPLGLLAALVAGAVHACAPGHGETPTAGYLVRGNGRSRDAVLLAVDRITWTP